jgi:predicted AAA+ superfamily ATPase
LTQACRLSGKREALILTLNQRDELKEDGVWVEVLPAWEWLLQDRGGQQPSAGA